MIEPRFADEGVMATLTRARALTEDHDFDSAALLFLGLLDANLTTPLRGEILTNLAAALCLRSRTQHGAVALASLDQARDLLVAALAIRQRNSAPAAWAATRASLALVYLTRYEATGSGSELMSAHLMLDGIEQALPAPTDAALRDWIGTIREQLLQRGSRRR
jgi:hypothetical protein